MRLERTAITVLIAAGLAAAYGWWSQPADDGVRTIDSAHQAPQLVERLTEAITEHAFDTNVGACGKCGVETIAVTDANAQVVTVTGQKLMMQLLKAGASVGVDPPLRFYVTALPDGGSRLTYHEPSRALAVYGVGAVEELGQQLDPVFAEIARQAAG